MNPEFRTKQIEKVRIKIKMLLLALEASDREYKDPEEDASVGIWRMKVDNRLDECFVYILTKRGLKSLEAFVPDLGDK